MELDARRGLQERFDEVVRGMVSHRSNTVIEIMNGLPQKARRAALFSTSRNFVAIACLRLSKLQHLRASPLVPATPSGQRSVPDETAQSPLGSGFAQRFEGSSMVNLPDRYRGLDSLNPPKDLSWPNSSVRFNTPPPPTKAC